MPTCIWQQAGLEQLNVDLVGTQVAAGDAAAHRRAAPRLPRPGDWIVGGGWDHTLWPGQKLPTRQDIDAVTGGHPAIFIRVDGHIAVANTAALKAAGITAQTADPPGGKIDHDARASPPASCARSAQRAGLSQDSAAHSCAAAPRGRTCAGRRRALGHHLGAGQFRVGKTFWSTKTWSAKAS